MLVSLVAVTPTCGCMLYTCGRDHRCMHLAHEARKQSCMHAQLVNMSLVFTYGIRVVLVASVFW